MKIRHKIIPAAGALFCCAVIGSLGYAGAVSLFSCSTTYAIDQNLKLSDKTWTLSQSWQTQAEYCDDAAVITNDYDGFCGIEQNEYVKVKSGVPHVITADIEYTDINEQDCISVEVQTKGFNSVQSAEAENEIGSGQSHIEIRFIPFADEIKVSFWVGNSEAPVSGKVKISNIQLHADENYLTYTSGVDYQKINAVLPDNYEELNQVNERIGRLDKMPSWDEYKENITFWSGSMALLADSLKNVTGVTNEDILVYTQLCSGNSVYACSGKSEGTFLKYYDSATLELCNDIANMDISSVDIHELSHQYSSQQFEPFNYDEESLANTRGMCALYNSYELSDQTVRVGFRGTSEIVTAPQFADEYYKKYFDLDLSTLEGDEFRFALTYIYYNIAREYGWDTVIGFLKGGLYDDSTYYDTEDYGRQCNLLYDSYTIAQDIPFGDYTDRTMKFLYGLDYMADKSETSFVELVDTCIGLDKYEQIIRKLNSDWN